MWYNLRCKGCGKYIATNNDDMQMMISGFIPYHLCEKANPDEMMNFELISKSSKFAKKYNPEYIIIKDQEPYKVTTEEALDGFIKGLGE